MSKVNIDNKGESAGLNSTNWTSKMLNDKKIVISDTYLDPASGKQIISIVTPVLSKDLSQVLGMMGMDVYMYSLSETLGSMELLST